MNTYMQCTGYVMNSGAGKPPPRLQQRCGQFEPKMRKRLNEYKKQKGVLYCGDLNCSFYNIDVWNSAGNQQSAGHTPEESVARVTLL